MLYSNGVAIQDYLREHGYDRLETDYEILHKQHDKYPNLFQFNYTIKTLPSSPIVRQARGIILDADNNWKIVCHTYNRFFNMGEYRAAPIDWNTAHMYEKLDGSLIQLYHYDGAWQIATRGTPNGSGPLPNKSTITFRQHFDHIWDLLGYELPEDTHCCYAFELLSPETRVITRQTEYQLILHGCRNIETGQEYTPESVAHTTWNVLRPLLLDTSTEATAYVEELDPLKQEGVVVVDSQFNRVKVKSPEYVRMHHIVYQRSARALLEMVRTGTTYDFTKDFPEFSKRISVLTQQYNLLIERTQKAYRCYKHIQNQKEFALSIKDLDIKHALFAMYKGYITDFSVYYQNMRIQTLETLI